MDSHMMTHQISEGKKSKKIAHNLVNSNKIPLIGSNQQDGTGYLFGSTHLLHGTSNEKSHELDALSFEDVNVEEKTINFKKLLIKYRQKTELSLPYTKQIIEDVMFVNQKKLVALESIFYQKKDGKIHKLKKVNKEKRTYKNPLGTDEYVPEEGEHSLLSSFRQAGETYHVSEQKDKIEDYVTQHLQKDRSTINIRELKERRTASKKSDILKNVQDGISKNFKKLEAPNFFMKTPNNGESVVEAILSLWNINQNGQLFKSKEVSFFYNSDYKQTKDGQMLLRLSGDQQYVSIDNVMENGKVELLAWDTQNLKSLNISKELQNSLTLEPDSEMKAIHLTGEAKYVMQKILVKKSQDRQKGMGKQLSKYKQWRVVQFDSGEVVLDINNDYNEKFSRTKTKIKDLEVDLDIRFLGILVNENQYDEVAEEEEISDQGDEKGSSLGSDSSYGSQGNLLDDEDNNNDGMFGNIFKIQSNKRIESVIPEEFAQVIVQQEEISKSENESDGGNINNGFDSLLKLHSDTYSAHFRESSICENPSMLKNSCENLNIEFFYASNINECISAKNKDYWIVSLVKIKLIDFLNQIVMLKNQRGTAKFKEELNNFIHKLGKDRLGQYEYQADKLDFFNVPKTWFFKDKINHNFEQQIDIMSNKYFTQFAFLNYNKRLYLAFDNKEAIDEPMGTYNFPKSQIKVSHGRNQYTKPYLSLTIRTLGDNSQTTVFFKKDIKKQIKFKNDYQNAMQDVQIQNFSQDKNPNGFEHLMLQSVTLSQDDQEIWMKTQKHHKHVMNHQNLRAETIQIIERKSQIQQNHCQYPVLLYNIGLRKMIIQNQLDNSKKQFLLDLNKNEIFLAHLHFNQNEDIGFYPYQKDNKGLFIEASSVFSFLTLDKFKKEVIINLLIVDPYYENTQFAFFRSTRRFTQKEFFGKKEYDIMLRNYSYCTKENQNDKNFDIKVISQYPTHLKQILLKKAQQNISKNELDDKIEFEDLESFDDLQSLLSDDQQLDINEENSDLNLADVRLLMDSFGHMYYVTVYEGQSQIIEINPKLDQMHMIIYEMKSEKPIGFSIDKDSFFILDQKKRSFSEVQYFDKIIISKNIVIHGSKIFYLKAEAPLANGILDFEDLSIPYIEEQKTHLQFVNGPIESYGATRFQIVYQDMKTFRFQTTIYRRPETQTSTMFSDKTQQVGISTFLDNNLILLQMAHRFFVFLPSGIFIDEIEFEDVRKERDDIAKKYLRHYVDKKKLKRQSTGGRSSDEIVNQIKNPWGKVFQKQMTLMKSESCKVEIQKIIIDRFNLQCMSDNNSFFLFEDKTSQTLKVYILKNANKNIEIIGKKLNLRQIDTFSNEQYEFSEKYEIDISKTDLFKHLGLNKNSSNWKQNTLNKINKAQITMRLNNVGGIYMFYYQEMDTYIVHCYKGHQMNLKLLSKHLESSRECQICKDTFKSKQKAYFCPICDELQHENCGKGYEAFNQDQEFNEEEDEDFLHIEVYGFRYDSSGRIYNMRESVWFPINARKDVDDIIDDQLKNTRSVIEQLQREQQQLPKEFRNPNEILKHSQHCLKLQDNKKHIFNCQLFDESLLIIQCGRFIKYAFLNINLKVKSEFKLAAINFDQSVIICKILGTQDCHQLQIIAKDTSKKLLIVVKWCFGSNTEKSMFQMKYSREDNQPENYVVKGIHKKDNYYIDENFVYDLEYNTPVNISLEELNSDKISSINQFPQQRKIYSQSDRFLGIDHPNKLIFPVNRIDLLFWKNLEHFGKDIELIIQNITLSHFSRIYDNYSLFHYFAENEKVIQHINHLYRQKQDEKTISTTEFYIPLAILKPDPNGHSALDLALIKQRIKSFEMMIDMLEEQSTISITKMMIKCMPQMIQSNSEMINSFFDNLIYRPCLMQQQVIIPWPDNLEEFIFASTTSLVNNQKSLNIELQNRHIVEYEERQHAYDVYLEQQGINPLLSQKNISLKGSTLIFQRNKGLDLTVDEGIDLKRIHVESIDLDWLFDEQNFKKFLILLGRIPVSDFFKQKGIKVVIQLAWQRYQNKILNTVFLPFIFFMTTFIAFAYELFTIEYKQLEKSEMDISKIVYSSFLGILLIAQIVLNFFYSYKIYETDKIQFFNNRWNFLNIGSNTLTLVLVLSADIMWFTTLEVNAPTIRLLCTFNVFSMWIRLLYWLAIFQNTSYFMTLIKQTVKDLKYFLFILILILIAFANIVSFMDISNIEGEQSTIIKNYSGNGIVDSLLYVWLLMLGEFDVDRLKNGPYKGFVMYFIFVFATFFFVVLLLNMIIAIMSDTFQQVYATRDETSLKQKVGLIVDNIWLIDLRKEFRNMRSIIRIQPIKSVKQKQVGTSSGDGTNNSIRAKNDKSQNVILDRLIAFEKGTRNFFKQHATRTQIFKNTISDLKTQLDEQKDKNGEIQQQLKEQSQMMRKILQNLQID